MRAEKAICERVLVFLDAQRLPPSPRNYRLAYALIEGSNAPLEKAVGAITDGGVRLTQGDAEQLCATFFGETPTPAPTRAPRAHPAADAIRHQTLRLADLAASVTTVTGDFGRELAARLPEIEVADTASLYELVVATMEHARRTEQELVATSAEVERLRQKLETVQGDAERDALTGLPNRRGIDAYLPSACGAKKPMVVALCDVDRFKSYNDTYGHAVGDRILKTVAQSLRESLPDHFVGRWGGEEFIVVAEGDVETGIALLEAAKAALGARHFRLRETDEPMGRISFSAGVVALPLEAGGLAATLEQADALLYRAKTEGRDRVLGAEPMDACPVPESAAA